MSPTSRWTTNTSWSGVAMATRVPPLVHVATTHRWCSSTGSSRKRTSACARTSHSLSRSIVRTAGDLLCLAHACAEPSGPMRPKHLDADRGPAGDRKGHCHPLAVPGAPQLALALPRALVQLLELPPQDGQALPAAG
eukprot:4493026-Alexandrium_andersonii.AAC.1